MTEKFNEEDLKRITFLVEKAGWEWVKIGNFHSLMVPENDPRRNWATYWHTFEKDGDYYTYPNYIWENII